MSGFKVLAANPKLQAISAEMREAKERKDRQARERLDRLRASLAAPALDLGSKLSPRIKEKLNAN